MRTATGMHKSFGVVVPRPGKTMAPKLWERDWFGDFSFWPKIWPTGAVGFCEWGHVSPARRVWSFSERLRQRLECTKVALSVLGVQNVKVAWCKGCLVSRLL